MKKFFSIIFTAYNEQETIFPSFLDARNTLKKLGIQNEIIFVNDCSLDNTQEEIDKVISKYQDVSSIANPTNKGPGKSFTKGVEMAKGDIILWLSADMEVEANEYLKHFKLFEKYDQISFYHNNPKSRSYFRYLISSIFTKILNFFFRTNLKYFNGPIFMKRDIYLKMKPKSQRFFFFAEVKLKTLRKGYSNIQVPITLKEKQKVRFSRNILTPLKITNLLDVLLSFIRVFVEIYFSNNFKKINK